MNRLGAALATLTRKLGPFHGPTKSGFFNFCHKECGDRKFRLGVTLKHRKFSCFKCGRKGSLDALVKGLPTRLPPGLGITPKENKKTNLPWGTYHSFI